MTSFIDDLVQKWKNDEWFGAKCEICEKCIVSPLKLFKCTHEMCLVCFEKVINCPYCRSEKIGKCISCVLSKGRRELPWSYSTSRYKYLF